MLFSILTSCIQQESQLEQAISQSGDNHIELEKVLLHYSVKKRKFAYLCAFNNEKWVPIHFGEISENTVTFENVGTGIACIAGYWINDEIVPASYPFLITSTGKPHYLRPDKKQTQTLRLKRKYPLVNWVNRNSDKMVGAKIRSTGIELPPTSRPAPKKVKRLARPPTTTT